MDSVMPFGMHKGSTMRQIVEQFPDYIRWLNENTDALLTAEVMDAIVPVDDFEGNWYDYCD